jgi:uncharacterized protein HemY
VISVTKWLLVLVLTVPLALLGWLLARDPGRLSLHIWGWQVDTTLVLALAILATFGAALWLAYWLIWQLPSRLLRRRQHSLALQFRHGLEDLAQARYAKARRRLVAASAIKDNAPLALLHAAQAAAHLGNHTDALALLARAQRFEEVRTAAELLAIKIKLSEGDVSQLAVLQSLAEQAEHPAPALTLAQELGARGRARDAMAVLAKLGKNASSNAGATHEWATMVRLALSQAATVSALSEVWALLGQREREQPDVLAGYCASALRLGDFDGVDAKLCAALKAAPSEILWQSYAQLSAQRPDGNLDGALKFVEALGMKPQSAASLLAAATLARRLGQTTAAEGYLARSLALEVTPLALREKGELRLKSGDFAGAIEAWRALIS